MKAKRVIAGIAALAMVGACGAAIVGCSGQSNSTVTTYKIEIDGKDYADWKAENEQPLDMGSGHRLWGIDTWAVGTKLQQDDNGDPVGAIYTYTLEIDTDCHAIGFVDYTLTYSAMIPASDTYKEPSTLVYSYQGYAYEIEGGYHLMVPNYAEGSLSSECLSETFGQFGGDEEDAIEYVQIAGPNGGYVYYCYTNSIIQAMGAKYNLPFMEPLLQGMSACDVAISGSAITQFSLTNEYAAEIKIPSPEVVVVPGTDEEEEEGGETTEDDWKTADPIEDDGITYDFAPGWQSDANLIAASDNTVTVLASAYNNFVMMGAPIGWNNLQVTFTFKADGTVEIAMLNTQDKTDTYTGTYTVYNMMNIPQYVIQLDNVAGSENPQTGEIEGGMDWSTVDEADKGVGGARIGMNTFYWISKDGKIVLSKMPNAETYGFNVAMGGGSLPQE